MNAFVDAGNTNIKIKRSNEIFVFENKYKAIKDQDVFAIFFEKEFIEKKIKKIILASVVPKLTFFFKSESLKTGIDIYVIEKKCNFIFTSEIEGAGIDRLLLIRGALTKYQPPFCVISCGTALTFDYVIKDEIKITHIGGFIMPGVRLMLKSLHQYTELLPLLEPEAVITSCGVNTKEAILSGVKNAISGAINTAIKDIEETITVLISGGDASYLLDIMPNERLILEPNLIFLGMEACYKSNQLANDLL